MQKVLIADDSIVSRHLLEATLRKWGYQVAVACDGAEAWAILQQDDAPSLAILDWVMPVLTGPEVCMKLRQRAGGKYIYTLLLTSKNQKEDLIEGMAAGADDYLTKPFDRQELQVRLEAGKRILRLHEDLFAAQQKLVRQATYDDLTGLFNRPRILESLRSEMARAAREQQPLGLVLTDIDKFKTINDTYGHAIGDSVLREAAQRMHASVRAYDAVGRYGGEEFMVVLPGCDLETTTVQAERLRLALGQAPMMVSDGVESARFPLPVSASFGATAAGPGHYVSVEALIKLADDALYEAKRMGRNRVAARAAAEPQSRPELLRASR
jgi:two-component system cell cycle response regulator